jgi:hypothetical protein
MINKKSEPVTLDTSKVYVMLFSYNWKKEGIAKFTAPFVRLFTGQLFNHAGLLIYALGKWTLYESAEGGVVKGSAQAALIRTGSRCIIREYAGAVSKDVVFATAETFVGVKYDTVNLVWHQLIYRITKTIAHNVNCFRGEEKYKGIWIGRTGEGAKGRLQCFEFIYCAFGLPIWWLASGAEFAKLADFKKEVYRD